MILRGCDICGTFDNVDHCKIHYGNVDEPKEIDLCPVCRQCLFSNIDSHMNKAAREFYEKQIDRGKEPL